MTHESLNYRPAARAVVSGVHCAAFSPIAFYNMISWGSNLRMIVPYSVKRFGHRLGQDSIHRRGQNPSNINSDMRKKPVSRGGPRSVLH